MSEEIKVLFRKGHWIIINKPAGISVHNEEDETNILELIEKQENKKYFAVHRLDKETSGILILSSSSDISASLQTALDKSSKKIYQGIVRGVLKKESGLWEQELTGKGEGRNNPQGVKAERVNAGTEFKVLNKNKFLSLMEFKLLTGRQHQIRKHCVLNKHEIIGDKRYGEPKYRKMINGKYDFKGMCLHAHKLSFTYKDELIVVEAPIPEAWNCFQL